MSEKREVLGRQRLLARFVCGPHNCLKNLSEAVNVPIRANRVLLRGRRLESKQKFFAQKLSNSGLNKLMQLVCIAEGAWERVEPPAAE